MMVQDDTIAKVFFGNQQILFYGHMPLRNVEKLFTSKANQSFLYGLII